MGVKRVSWFGGERRFASRKSPEFPRRNAKTRWVEPAGLERNGHVAVTKSMEAVSWTRNGAKKPQPSVYLSRQFLTNRAQINHQVGENLTHLILVEIVS
jgi:hypothetical protein